MEPSIKKIIQQMTFNKNEKILDVGTGPGDFTSAFLLKYLPSDCSIVGSDISEEMVNYARSHFTDPRLTLKLLDIGSSNIWLSWEDNSFDKIFAFYCLHWVRDLKHAVETLALLLKKNGDLTSIIVQKTPYFHLFRKLYEDIQSPEKKKVMRAFQGLYQDFDCKEFNEILELNGFEIISAELLEHDRHYDTTHVWRDFAESINPFLCHLTGKEREEVSDKSAKFMLDQGLVRKTPAGAIEYKYTVYVVQAKKSRPPTV